MADRRYSTAAWQRLRRSVLRRDGYQCQLRGPKCTGRATTAHHILPSSTHPERFFDPSNLQAPCKPCNYSGGRQIAVDNRTNRQLVTHLQSVVDEQQAMIEEQHEEIAELRRELEQRPERRRAVEPRIY